MRIIILLAFFMVLSTMLKSQPYYFRHYQVEQGLSHNSVTSSLQDKQGFLWFGTKDGLNRFDGYTFKIFRTEPEDTAGFGSNFILSLCENKGTLWVGTDKGLYRYHEKNEKFSLLHETANRYIREIKADRDGNLWFIANNTLYRYNDERQSLKTYDKSRHFDATAICSDAEGNLWISSSSGTINRYEPATDSFISYDVFEHSKPAATKWIEKIYGTTQNSILVGTQSQGIKLFDIHKAEYKDVLSCDPDSSGLFVRDFVKNTDEEYWVATESGIYIFNISKESLSSLRKSYNDPYSISDNAVYTVYKDQEGGIWAGTYFGGLNYFPKQYTSFEKFFPKIGENSISGNAVREICQDRYGKLWVGTEDAGLNKYDPETGTFTNFKPTGDNSISHYNIHALLARSDELWIGTFHQGLDVLDIKTGKLIRHYSSGTRPGSLKDDFIFSMFENPSGDIFVGTSAGIYQYQPASDDFMAVSSFPEAYHYTVIQEDSQGTLWAGTYMDGIYYYNAKTQEKGFFKNDPHQGTSLSSNAVNGIFEDSRQNLWITTANGLNKLDPQQKSFKRFTTQHGLPSNVTYRILEDNAHKLWISTSKGLVYFDPATEKVLMVYTKAHGLLSDQLNYSSAFKDEDGRMYFGSVKGLISFKHADFIQNTYIPPVYLTGFQVHNKELPIGKDGSPLDQSITFTDKVTLNHDQSSFSIDFAALSYTAPEMAEYAYKLEGLDQDWTYMKSNRKVFFTKLPPGDYSFMVKASNSSGLWNEKATTLSIEVLPPFWATPWAYVLYSLLALVIFYYVIYTYHKRAEKKNNRKISQLENEKEKEIYQAKIEFFTTIAHEIRTPLTLINGPLEKAIKSSSNVPEVKEPLRIIEKNTSRLLELVNQLLDFRKTETKGFSLSFTKTNINELIKEIYLRFKPAAEQKNLSFTLHVPSTPLYAYVDREAFTKIVSNLFSNTLKYADSKVEIHLALHEADQHFTLLTKNDGYLIQADTREKIFTPFFRIKETENKLGTGIGLPLSRSLAELHNGSLKLEGTEKDMNVFVLRLPIHQDNEFKLLDELLPAEQVSPAVKTNEKPSDTKPAILLVEDNPEMLEFIGSELGEEYRIFKAYDGESALQILNKECVQLVVSDISMPAMNGIEFCRIIKSNIEYSHIPLILLTAKTNLQSKIEGLESGADAYMEKPFSPEHLKVQIANLLSNRSKIKNFFSSSPLAHIKSIAYSKADESFLEELNDAIYRNIADSDLNVEQLADIMNMSRPTFYRKIKAISDLTPNELINLARLKKAAELLAEGNYKIYEIASIVGYKSQTSFGRNFLKQFGMKPKEYAQAKKGMLSK